MTNKDIVENVIGYLLRVNYRERGNGIVPESIIDGLRKRLDDIEFENYKRSLGK